MGISNMKFSVYESEISSNFFTFMNHLQMNVPLLKCNSVYRLIFDFYYTRSPTVNVKNIIITLQLLNTVFLLK